MGRLKRQADSSADKLTGGTVDSSAAPPAPRTGAKAKTPWPVILFRAIIVLGLLVCLWPVATDWWGALEARDVIDRIEDTYDAMADPARLECLEQARAWNASLRGEDPGMELWDYRHQLTWSSTTDSMMAWVEVPKVSLRLPIFHGTGEAELMAGAGHVEWSALPVGGVGGRCVLTAHSGMQTARMFDDVRKLEEGDVFVLRTLGEPYAYRVCDVRTCWPEDVEGLLRPEEGRDLCTLMTCTPLGVNSHRLLVTGERCTYKEDTGDVAADASIFLNWRTIPFLVAIALVILITLVAYLLRRRAARARRNTR